MTRMAGVESFDFGLYKKRRTMGVWTQGILWWWGCEISGVYANRNPLFNELKSKFTEVEETSEGELSMHGVSWEQDSHLQGLNEQSDKSGHEELQPNCFYTISWVDNDRGQDKYGVGLVGCEAYCHWEVRVPTTGGEDNVEYELLYCNSYTIKPMSIFAVYGSAAQTNCTLISSNSYASDDTPSVT